jgi:fatty acid desaturase
MKIFSDILDHAFSDEKTQNHFFKIKILNLIFFPRNDAYHLVHHLFPRAPVCEFKKIHEQLLLQQNEYGKLKHKLF